MELTFDEFHDRCEKTINLLYWLILYENELMVYYRGLKGGKKLKEEQDFIRDRTEKGLPYFLELMEVWEITPEELTKRLGIVQKGKTTNVKIFLKTLQNILAPNFKGRDDLVLATPDEVRAQVAKILFFFMHRIFPVYTLYTRLT